jgi:hypothetical protein
VASSDQESTAADSIGDVAESEHLLGGEVGDLAVLLLVAGVAVEHDTCDLRLGGVCQTLHGRGHDGGALRVAAGYDDGVGALGRGQLEEALGLAICSACGALGQSVLADASGVGGSDALAGDVVGAVMLLEAFAGRGTDGRALSDVLVEKNDGLVGKCAYNVTDLGGATSEDESEGFACTVRELVHGRANIVAELPALEVVGGKSSGSASEESDGGGELHVCGLNLKSEV